MRKMPSYSCDMMCTICNNIFQKQFSVTKKKEMFSLKTEWCFKCKSITQHIVLLDKTYAFKYLNEKLYLDEKEQYALNMLLSLREETNNYQYKKK